MTFELDHDLTAWADGTLSREDLFTLQGQQARTVVALHERLLGAAEMATPDPVAGWALLHQNMDAKVVSIRTRPRRGLRRAMLGVAAAALIGGGAIAAIRGGAVDHPAVLAPSTGIVAPRDETGDQTSGRQGGLADDVGDRSGAPSSAGATASDGSVQATSGSDGTTGGDGAQDPKGRHPGPGNGGEDNGNDGPHGHGGASAPARG